MPCPRSRESLNVEHQHHGASVPLAMNACTSSPHTWSATVLATPSVLPHRSSSRSRVLSQTPKPHTAPSLHLFPFSPFSRQILRRRCMRFLSLFLALLLPLSAFCFANLKMPPVTHVLFDMDGLLLDTERVYTVVTQRIVERYGKNFEWGLKSKMMGRRAMEAAQILVDELKIPLSPEDYLAEREEAHDKMWPEVSLMPGAERLVRHLKKHGVPQGVATSSHRAPFDAKTSRHQPVFSLFDTIVTGDDQEVTKGKPSPDIFEVCARRLPHPPADGSTCLVFEDAVNGVEAAKAAGMRCVLVPDPNMRDAVDVSSCGATAVLSSLQDFRPEDFGLPPYDDT